MQIIKMKYRSFVIPAPLLQPGIHESDLCAYLPEKTTIDAMELTQKVLETFYHGKAEKRTPPVVFL